MFAEKHLLCVIIPKYLYKCKRFYRKVTYLHIEINNGNRGADCPLRHKIRLYIKENLNAKAGGYITKPGGSAPGFVIRF